MQHAVFNYGAAQWLLFFYTYCFFGWIFESTYVSLKEKHPVNRGFLHGPFLPLYGSGAVLMLFVSIPVEKNPVLVYFAGCIAATALEYVTGVCMEALFKVRYWDYSDKKFNYKGQICLGSTLAWGCLTVLLVYVIHRPIEQFVLGLPYRLTLMVTYAVTIVMAIDMALSFKAALELRDVLASMTAVRQKLETLQHRADAILAFAQGDRPQTASELGLKVKGAAVERLESVFGKLEQYKEKLGSYREESESLRLRFEVLKDRSRQAMDRLGYHNLSILRNNPGVTSRHFREALGELKEAALKGRKSQAEEQAEK